MTTSAYAFSFTVGGLFLFEGIELARMRRSGLSWNEVRRTVPGGVFVAKGAPSSIKRIRNEVIGRISLLDDGELALLAEAGTTDARALMWVAACRKYRILAEFAFEVLDERLRTYQPEIRAMDFDQHLDAKGVLAEDVARLAPSTRQRLRSVTFRMLREAEILDAERRVRPLPISGPLHDLLARNRRAGIDLIPGGA